MKYLPISFALLVAAPALAHPAAQPHAHASETLGFLLLGLGLILAGCGASALAWVSRK